MSCSVWSLLPLNLQKHLRDSKNALDTVMITGLSADSRQIQTGDVFFGVPGTVLDGREYVDQALQAGAVLAVVESTPVESVAFLEDQSIVQVTSVVDLMGQMASAFFGYPSKALKVVGITGTNGKTTTSYMVASLAGGLGVSAAVMGTNGYGPIDGVRPQKLTTPGPIQLHAQLAELRDMGVKLVAMEVSSHALAQNRASGCDIAVAVLTNVSRDHLDYHGGMAEYVAAKQLLFTRSEIEHVIVNAEDSYADGFLMQSQAAGHDAMSWVYASSAADLKGLNSREQTHRCTFSLNSGQTGSEVTVRVGNEGVQVNPALTGTFNYANLTAAILVHCALGYTLAAVAGAMSKLTLPDGRMQSLWLDELQVVIDFAHTPDAVGRVLSALKLLAQEKGGDLVVVFGCGGDRDRGKRALMAAEVQQQADAIIVTSDNPRSEAVERIFADIEKGFDEVHHITVKRIDNRSQAIQHAIACAGPRDIVAILGKGHEKYQDISGRRNPFDDIEEAQKACLRLSKKV